MQEAKGKGEKEIKIERGKNEENYRRKRREYKES